MSGRSSSLPAPLIAVGALFLLGIGYLIATSLAPRHAPAYRPSPIAARHVPEGATVVDTLTVDARDERTWQFVDFDRRSVVVPPDTAGWDIAVRRFHVMTAGGMRDLGRVPFDSIRSIPDTGYRANHLASDTLSPTIGHWYEYNMLTHLLTPKRHSYAIRTREGHYAKLAIVSYYCPELQAGCLTMAYAYPMPMR